MNFMFIIPGFFNLDLLQKGLYYNDLPLGTLQISSYLKQKYPIKTDIIDMRIEEETDSRWDSESNNIQKFKEHCLKAFESNNLQDFKFIGINCYTSFQYLQSKIIAELIKKEFKNKIIFVGGYHPSSVPKDFCYKHSPFDFIIKDEAEIILSEYLKNQRNRTIKENKIPKIINSQQLINLNDLPPPDYKLYLNKYPYHDKFKFELYTSRGCPYQCSFCSLNYKFRIYSYENFENTFERLLDLVLQYNKKYPKITFADQAFFSISIKDEILDYIIEKELSDFISFACQSRVETVARDPNIIKKVRKANLIVGYGLESADKLLLTEMKKTQNPIKYLEMMRKILNVYKTKDMNYCRLNLLCGFPGENKETFNNTIKYIEEYALHEKIQLSPSLFACYPNTPSYHNMDYYEKKYGTEFNREWWIYNKNHFKLSVLKKCSSHYPLIDLLYDYKEKYSELLRTKNFSFSALVLWKQFYSKWYKELLSQSF